MAGLEEAWEADRRTMLRWGLLMGVTGTAGCAELIQNARPTGAGTTEQTEGGGLPDIEISAATVTERYVTTDRPFSLAVELRNSGAGAGSKPLAVQVGGETIGEKTVDVPAGERKTVSFRHTLERTGTYDVSLNGTHIGNVEVLPRGYPTFKVDVKNSGVSGEKGPREGVGQLWEFSRGNSFVSSAATDGNRVYVGLSEGQEIVAIDLASGDEVWSVDTSPTSFANPIGPTLVDGTLYITGIESHARGELFAVDMETGDTVWSQLTVVPSGSVAHVEDQLVLSGNRAGTPGVAQMDAETGEIRWFAMPDEFSEPIKLGEHMQHPQAERVMTPAVADDSVFISTSERTEYGVEITGLYRLSLSDGSLEWKNTTGSTLLSSPVVGDNVYLNMGIAALAFDKQTGEKVWGERFIDTETGGGATPAVAHGNVYATLYEHVVAFDEQSGNVVWDTEVGRNCSRSSPIVTSDTVYVISNRGFALGLDAHTGEILFEEPTGRAGSFVTPVVSDEKLIVPSETAVSTFGAGKRRTQDRANPSRLKWKFDTGSPIENEPEVSEKFVVVSNQDGYIYAVSRSDGTEEWASDYPDIKALVTDLAIVDETVYSAFDDGTIAAIDIFSGAVRWTHAVGDYISSLEATADRIYAGTMDAGTVHAIDRHEPAEVWQTQLASGGTMIRLWKDGIYAASRKADPTSLITAIDQTDGSKEWVKRIEKLNVTPFSIGGGNLYAGLIVPIGSDRGKLTAFDIQTGESRWTMEKATFGTAYADGTVFAVTGDLSLDRQATLIAIDPKDGEPHWDYSVEASITGPPMVANNTVFFAELGEFSTIHAVNASSGEKRWEFETDVAGAARLSAGEETLYAASPDNHIYAIDLTHNN